MDANNMVVDVVSVSNEVATSEDAGVAFLQQLYGADTVWLQCSYNAAIRKHYPGIGYTYQADIDAFVPPQPYPSWTLDADANWQPPTPMPTDGIYVWNESTLSWDKVS
jgi:hypothetical protein